MDNSKLKPTHGYKSVVQGFTAVILLISLVVPFRSGKAIPYPPIISFTVNTDSDLGDASPGDFTCATSGGECSLRAAIDEMNASAPVTGGVIDFDGDYTITLDSIIFILANNVTITGAGHVVTIIRSAAPTYEVALWLAGDGGQVDHVTVICPDGYGIYIAACEFSCPGYPVNTGLGNNYVIDHVTAIGSDAGIGIIGDDGGAIGATAANNTVQNSYIGITETHLSDLMDLSRPLESTDCEPDEINIHAFNIYFTYGTTIKNNQIICNSYMAIYDVASSSMLITGNTVAGNGLVSGGHGIDLNGTDNVTITSNFIGNLGGTTPFQNYYYGIRIEPAGSYYVAHDIQIGGTGATDGNIISGNYGDGIFIQGGSHDISIDRNLIGLDANHEPMPNGFGISIYQTSYVTIGSDDHTLYQQFVSGNTWGGIGVSSSDHVVIKDNTLIGIASWSSDSLADVPAGNGRDGISIYDSTNVTVESWKVANSEWSGIYVQGDGSLHNTFLPKNIYNNGRLPIDLEPYGFTPNDLGDADSGPNDLLNYPEITGVVGAEITGTACAGCQVYFYRAVKNPGANGGGGTYDLGMLPATVDGSGVWTATLPEGVQSTDLTMLTYDGTTEQTSEFTPVPYTPTLTVNTNSDEPDVNPGDSFCATATGNDICSLRAAVEELNAYGAGGLVNFSDDLSAYNITLGDAITLEDDDISIDGNGHVVTLTYTPVYYNEAAFQLAASGGRLEHLNIKSPFGYGTAISIGDPARTTKGNEYILDHLTVLGSYVGIAIFGNTAGTKGSNNIIQNSYIGVAEGNLAGLVDPAEDCLAEDQNEYGIFAGGGLNNSYLDNQILCNSIYGLFIDTNDATTVAGDTNIAGNTIAGNGNNPDGPYYDGLVLEGADTSTITGNYIGNLNGTTPFPNGVNGIRISDSSANITIGGSGVSDGNIISGNLGNGIDIEDESHDILVDHNLIGLAADHNNMGNYLGIFIANAHNITIGSDDHTVYQQYISSNTNGGIQSYDSDHIRILDNNLIGLSNPTEISDPESPSGNGLLGVFLGPGSTYVEIDAWKIAYNGGSGVSVLGDDSLYNRIQPKNVYNNSMEAIDLGSDGPTINDDGDLDSGPNDLLNYPIITGQDGNTLTGVACPGCLVFFYRRLTEPWQSGAKYDLGISPVAADGETGVWEVTLPAGLSSRVLALMAYDDNTLQTSEFNQPFFLFLPALMRP